MNTEHQLKSKLTSVQKVWNENESGTGTMTRTKNAVFIGLSNLMQIDKVW